MKHIKRALAIVMVLTLCVSLSGCFLLDKVFEKAAVELAGELGGDEFSREVSEGYENYKQEKDIYTKQLEELMKKAGEELKEDAYNELQEKVEEKIELQTPVIEIVAWILDFLKRGAWDYPVTDPKCTWRSYEEETMSWGEWEMKDSSGGGREYHLALDLKSASGDTSVYAAADGEVVYASTSTKDKDEGNGYRVIIEHEIDGETVYSLYAHLAEYSDLPAVGTMVSKGDRIGTIGSTGNSGGPHVHFAVMKNLQTNPYGRATYFTGNVTTFGGNTFYNPKYIIENGHLPEE